MVKEEEVSCRWNHKEDSSRVNVELNQGVDKDSIVVRKEKKKVNCRDKIARLPQVLIEEANTKEAIFSKWVKKSKKRSSRSTLPCRANNI